VAEEPGAAPIVVLSSIDWDAAWQRHQVFASLWAAAGRDVYFVENLGFRAPSLGDWRRVAARLLGLVGLGARRGARSAPPERLRVVSPALLPPTSQAFRMINRAVLAPHLAGELRARGLGSGPVVVAYLPTETTLALLDELAPRAVVYDCVDNFAGHPARPPDLERTESALLSRADLVLTTSKTLYEARAKDHPRVLELHQGVPDAFFIDARARRPHKRFCYFGTLWDALDYELVRALAAAGFEVDMIGPRKQEPPPLPASVRLKDALPHESLPDALRGYDALLLPYRRSDYNVGVAPAKLYECLATGLPVLCSPLPALEGMGDVLTLADGPEAWVAAARALDASDTPAARERRLALAREHRQSRVFARLREELERALSRRPRPAAGGRLTLTRAFVSGIAYLGLPRAAAQASTLATLAAAARWLGPDEYGKAATTAGLAALMRIAPSLGYPASLSQADVATMDKSEREKLFSSALLLFFTVSAVVLTALMLGRERLAESLDVSEVLFDLSVLLGYASAFALVAASPLSGLMRFGRRGAVDAVTGLALPLLLAGFVAAGRDSFESVVLSRGIALALGASVAVAALKPRLTIDRSGASAALRGFPLTATRLLGLALLAAPQPLLLAHYESWAAAGVFAAYCLVTIQPALALSDSLSTVLERVAQEPGSGTPWLAFGARAAAVAAVTTLGFFAATAALTAVLGPRYPFDAAVAGLTSLAAGLTLVAATAQARLSERRLAGMRISAVGQLIAGLANAWLAAQLVPGRGLLGAAQALAGAAAAQAVFQACLLARRQP
jgi:hypothetical protein